jgi:glycogen(starch) synthase
MKILTSTVRFFPSVGGLQTVSDLLATEFSRAGHEVKLITPEPGPPMADRPYELIRNPSASTLLSLVRWCDIYYQNHIYTRMLWPLLLVRRPAIISYHGDLPTRGGRARLRRILVRHVPAIAVSHATARNIGAACAVIHNPYDEAVFYERREIERSKELVFLGNLSRLKGVDLLIEALFILKQRGIRANLTVIGSGSDEDFFRELAARWDLLQQIDFAGQKPGEELAQLLGEHRILVVPSRCSEGFGVVALEGIACGCLVVGSRHGGLPEAIGPCGISFPNGNSAALADALEKMLKLSRAEYAELRSHAAAHLAPRSRARVAAVYLEHFESMLTGHLPIATTNARPSQERTYTH